ncbi:MAG: prepilin-type N-terminal cleavage/methylation domain-containing protein [Nitrospinae bacterium]|nr:prepilin-type N-terminal cleavage/methylation domain-containing protein [Nitrospinota bacterium]
MRLNEYLKSNQKGFSLIELLIALAIGSIVLLAAYNLFMSQKKSHELQGQLVDAEQNARAALDLLTRELRLAGSGVTRTTATLISDAAAGATTLNVASSTGFSSGNTIYLINIPANNPTVAESRTITAIANNIFTVAALLNTYTAFSTEIFKEETSQPPIIAAQAITAATENSITFSAVIVDGDPATDVTYSFLNTNNADCESPNIGTAFSPCRITRNTGSGNQPLAENIDYFQIRYYDAKGWPIPNSGPPLYLAPVPYTAVNLTETERARIRKVNIQIVAVASRDETGYTATGTYDDGTTYANRGSSNRRRTLLEADILMTNMIP